jgi:hypothetical protein
MYYDIKYRIRVMIWLGRSQASFSVVVGSLAINISGLLIARWKKLYSSVSNITV